MGLKVDARSRLDLQQAADQWDRLEALLRDHHTQHGELATVRHRDLGVSLRSEVVEVLREAWQGRVAQVVSRRYDSDAYDRL